jgi:hypothetical protein
VWGCSGDALDLEWTISFADESLRTQAHLVEPFIVEGGCSGADAAAAIWSDTALASDMTGARPPSLSPGTYGFAARAHDIGCQWYAEGCEEVELGNANSPTLIRTIMDAVPTPMDACGGLECVAGRCDVPDTGVMDTGVVDTGVMDTGGADADTSPPDDTAVPMDTAVPDTTVDTGPMCVPATEICNGMDDNCDLSIDEAGCPCDREEFGGTVYLFCTAGLNFAAAEAACSALGYHLVFVESAAEQTFVWTQAESRAAADWWLGLHDRTTEGTFTWLDGTVVWDASGAAGYENFRGGAPEADATEDCQELDEAAGEWAGASCAQSQPYVCEL